MLFKTIWQSAFNSITTAAYRENAEDIDEPGKNWLGQGPTLEARVAELADALDSGSSSRKAVGVQVPPLAPIFSSMIFPFSI